MLQYKYPSGATHHSQSWRQKPLLQGRQTPVTKKINDLLITITTTPLCVVTVYLHDCSKKVTDFCFYWGSLYTEKSNLGPPFISKGGSKLILAPLHLQYEDDKPMEP